MGAERAKLSGVLGFKGPTLCRGEPLQDYAGPVLGGMCPASGTDDIANWASVGAHLGGAGISYSFFSLSGITMRQKSPDHPNASLVG